MPTLQLLLLGALDIRYDDQPLSKPPTLEAQSLLAYLATHRQKPQPRERLATEDDHGQSGTATAQRGQKLRLFRSLQAPIKTDFDTVAAQAERVIGVVPVVIKQLLIDGFFHADPHPGNILVNLQTGQINFIDCGMVGQLDVAQRMNLIQLIFALQQGDVAGMGQILRNLSVPFAGKVDEKAYQRDFQRVISRQMYVGGSAGFGQTVNLGLELLRAHGLRLDPNLTMAIKALMQAEAFTTLLFPEGGIVAQGAEMVREMALQAVTADKVVEVVKDQVMMTARELLKRVPSLQEATLGWLDQYQKGRFEVHLDTSGLDKSVDKLAGFGRQVIIALMLVGMIVGSAIATSVIALIQPDGQYWSFASRLAYLGFVVPMIVAILLVFRLLWRWFRG